MGAAPCALFAGCDFERVLASSVFRNGQAKATIDLSLTSTKADPFKTAKGPAPTALVSQTEEENNVRVRHAI